MKLRTWHMEGLVVASALAGALVAFGRAGDWREWVAALGVQLGFHHASVANRLQEAEESRASAARDTVTEHGLWVRHVDCVRWLNRYWVGKELAWVAYFLAMGLVACFTRSGGARTGAGAPLAEVQPALRAEGAPCTRNSRSTC